MGMDKNKVRFNFNKYIRPEFINLNLKGKDKKEVIEELLAILSKKNKIKNLSKIKEEIWKREKMSSTGLGDGIAIPHIRTVEVKELTCVIGISRSGIEFNSFDKELCFIFVLTLSPKNIDTPHLQFMSFIIKKLLSISKEEIFFFKKEKDFFKYLTAK